MYDRPGELKIHVGAIPRIGGVAIAIAFLLALITGGQLESKEMIYFLVALALVWLVGFIDDVRDLPPSIRLLAQTISGVMLYCNGIRVAISTSTVINFIGTIILILWFVNAFNFVDGSDGIAAGMAAVAASAFVALFAIQHISGLLVVAVALLGCCLGFLLFNFPPASIFMGDSGSTMLGFVLVWLALGFVRSQPGSNLGLAAPLLFSSLPLADATFAVIRRVRERKSPFAGDRRHFYDLLLHRGWSPRRVAVASYAAAAIFAFLGLLAQYAHIGGEVVVGTSALIMALGLTLGSLGVPRYQVLPETAHSENKRTDF
jgi:UDP-GlcNAc:undecaprenyl-phosphate/decaprenyl-phosphate GlcNAc-1-phosphate transferase